jgi:hypothetical protein
VIVVVCLLCSLGFRVKGADTSVLLGPESDLWPDGFTCPGCSQPARGYLENEISEALFRVLQIRDLTPIEGFSTLVAGVGLPEDRECRKDVIEGLLQEYKIKVVGKDIPNTPRFSIDFMELLDGTRLYFGSSGHGAIIYRVSKERLRGGSGG